MRCVWVGYRLKSQEKRKKKIITQMKGQKEEGEHETEGMKTRKVDVGSGRENN